MFSCLVCFAAFFFFRILSCIKTFFNIIDEGEKLASASPLLPYRYWQWIDKNTFSCFLAMKLSNGVLNYYYWQLFVLSDPIVLYARMSWYQLSICVFRDLWNAECDNCNELRWNHNLSHLSPPLLSFVFNLCMINFFQPWAKVVLVRLNLLTQVIKYRRNL